MKSLPDNPGLTKMVRGLRHNSHDREISVAIVACHTWNVLVSMWSTTASDSTRHILRMDILIQTAHFYNPKPLVRQYLDTNDDLAYFFPPSLYLLGVTNIILREHFCSLKLDIQIADLRLWNCAART